MQAFENFNSNNTFDPRERLLEAREIMSLTKTSLGDVIINHGATREIIGNFLPSTIRRLGEFNFLKLAGIVFKFFTNIPDSEIAKMLLEKRIVPELKLLVISTLEIIKNSFEFKSGIKSNQGKTASEGSDLSWYEFDIWMTSRILKIESGGKFTKNLIEAMPSKISISFEQLMHDFPFLYSQPVDSFSKSSSVDKTDRYVRVGSCLGSESGYVSQLRNFCHAVEQILDLKITRASKALNTPYTHADSINIDRKYSRQEIFEKFYYSIAQAVKAYSFLKTADYSCETLKKSLEMFRLLGGCDPQLSLSNLSLVKIASTRTNKQLGPQRGNLSKPTTTDFPFEDDQDSQESIFGQNRRSDYSSNRSIQPRANSVLDSSGFLSRNEAQSTRKNTTGFFYEPRNSVDEIETESERYRKAGAIENRSPSPIITIHGNIIGNNDTAKIQTHPWGKAFTSSPLEMAAKVGDFLPALIMRLRSTSFLSLGWNILRKFSNFNQLENDSILDNEPLIHLMTERLVPTALLLIVHSLRLTNNLSIGEDGRPDRINNEYKGWCAFPMWMISRLTIVRENVPLDLSLFKVAKIRLIDAFEKTHPRGRSFNRKKIGFCFEENSKIVGELEGFLEILRGTLRSRVKDFISGQEKNSGKLDINLMSYETAIGDFFEALEEVGRILKHRYDIEVYEDYDIIQKFESDTDFKVADIVGRRLRSSREIMNFSAPREDFSLLNTSFENLLRNNNDSVLDPRRLSLNDSSEQDRSQRRERVAEWQ